MDSVSRYGFINSKLRARIGQIQSSHLFDSMIKAGSLSEAINYLAGTRYEPLIKVYEKTGDLQAVEKELLDEEILIHKEIISYMDDKTASFLKIILERLEEDNLKNAIRLWYSSNFLYHPMSYRASYIHKEEIVNPINYERIVNATSFKEVLSAVDKTPFYEIFSSYSEESIREYGLFNLEIKLDHLWYDRLFHSINQLSKADKEVSSQIYLVDVDLKNILYLIRYGYFHHFTQKRLEDTFISYGKVYEGIRKKSHDEINKDEVKRIATRYYPVLKELFEDLNDKDELISSHFEIANNTLRIEDYLASRRKKEFTSILRGDPFNIGTILSYLFLCKCEDQTLKGVLSAKYYLWDEERIRREIE